MFCMDLRMGEAEVVTYMKKKKKEHKEKKRKFGLKCLFASTMFVRQRLPLL